ncbi:glycosyltransferase family 2 protein [Nocardioides sp. Iso805N]|uniref:glycosyltransferase family 2 protein n=1 Tax=Nocardioides sp. Iso805N TaxID=1283287 RepID=UPI0003732AB8|nr:galactosyltransferase-related protein [Nocardioides sp. Iso805N]
MSTAVVTIAHGRHQHLLAQQHSLLAGSLVPEIYVVVAMDDPRIADGLSSGLRPDVVHLPADPRGLPLAAARNAGAERALDSGAEIVIMLDVDCLAGHDLVDGYAEVASTHPTAVWSGPVTYLPAEPRGYRLIDLDAYDAPHAARPAPEPGEVVLDASPDLFWSLSFGLHRRAWTQAGGFCEGYVGYGGEDTDFGHTALARGLRLGWAGTPRAYHQYHSTADPPYQHLDDILRNGRLFRSRWGRWPMQGWLDAFARGGLIECREGDWVRTETRSTSPHAAP